MGWGAEQLVGRRVGRYEIVRALGAGGVGTVLEALDHALARPVALKVLHRSVRLSSDSLARFQREAQLLAQLAHPNVVQVFEVGRLDGVPFLAMELVRGASLRDWLDTPRSTDEILDVFRQAATGLRAAHQVGVVHRDFKLDNVVVGEDGRVRVVDFGLATLAAETSTQTSGKLGVSTGGSRLTETGVVLGTPAYMAPEQHVGGRSTARSDQFSFCVALYEGLYGVRPFAGRNAVAILRKISDGDFAKPRRPHKVNAQLRRAMRRGLDADPDRRWPDIDPLVEALGRRRPAQRTAWVGMLPVVAVFLALGSANELVGATVSATAPTTHETALDAPEVAKVEIHLDRARELRESMAFDEALQEARSAARLATRMSSASLEAEAHLLIGTIHSTAGRESDAANGYSAAYYAALEGRDDEVAARAAAKLVEQAAVIEFDLDEANRWLAASAAVVRRLEPDHEQQAWHRVAEAQVARSAGRYQEAVTARVDALRRIESRYGRDDIRIVALMTLLADDYVAVGKHEEAAAALGRADAIVLAQRGPDHPQTAEVASARCRLAFRRADFVLAEAQCRRARQILEAAYGSDHDMTLDVTFMLQSVLQEQGKATDAEQVMREAAEHLERRHGADHPETVVVWVVIAGLLTEREANDEAEALYWRGIETLRRSAPQSRALVMSLVNYANFLSGLGRRTAAPPLVEEAIEIIEATFGPDHAMMTIALLKRGEYAAFDGRNADAREAYQRALDIAIKTHGEGHPDTAQPHCALAGALHEAGDIEAAEKHFREAVAIEEASGGPDSPRLGCALTGWGEALFEDGRSAEAAPILERMVAIADSRDVYRWYDVVARATLAKIVLPTDRRRAVALAKAARARCPDAADFEDLARDLDAWLARN